MLRARSPFAQQLQSVREETGRRPSMVPGLYGSRQGSLAGSSRRASLAARPGVGSRQQSVVSARVARRVEEANREREVEVNREKVEGM